MNIIHTCQVYENKIRIKNLDRVKIHAMMAYMATRPGRPVKAGEHRTNKLPLCLTESERKSLDAAAQSKGMDTSVWVRVVALDEAQKVNKAIDTSRK
jgi:hypothetical protein